MAQAKSPDNLLSPQQVADMLGVHKNTVKLWITQGKLKAEKLGYRTLRIVRREVDNFRRAETKRRARQA